MKKLIITLSILFTSSSIQAEECDFDCTLQRHLDAIQAKDFEKFESTLTQGDRLTFILPDGRYFEDAKQYRDILKAWLADPNWTFEYKIMAVEKTDQMGSALLLIDYNEKERDGKPYHLDHYLSLIFKKEGNGWYLVHDQNTITKLKE